ncbi:MAG: sigma-54 dependent transcriptional regulator [Polyangiaceae bacterium]|nr:sigma-54 dependent transcriptional regulator [Polyangiaceae bacterium]
MTGRTSLSGEMRAVVLQEQPPRVLVVDDEPALRRSLARLLMSRGMQVLTAGDGEIALEVLNTEAIDVALVDLMLPKLGGLDVLKHIKSGRRDVEVIMMTAFADVDTAVSAVRAGAYHFLTKPFRSNDEVVLTVSKAAEHRRLLDHTAMLQRRIEQMEKFGGLIGNSEGMREVYRLALGVAPTGSTVLILGESGTGKELTARAIHQHSSRSANPFVAVNCSAIPENLIESELFGHVRGAFTGATATRPGLFEAADRGTIFLDEVGDLPPLAQVKLLRTLQEGEIKRVGSNDTRLVDVRVVAATNVDLRQRIQEGKFREDLYYRLNVVPIVLPPLRERLEDIPLLAYHFLQKYGSRSESPVRKISPDAMRLLQRQAWPGNVRELENAIERAVVFCRTDSIVAADLPFSRREDPVVEAFGEVEARSQITAVQADLSGLADLPYTEAKRRAVGAFESSYFRTLLERAGGNVSEAARQAGLDRSNFRRATKRVGIRTVDEP